MEESGYTDSDFKIIDNIEPIIEEFYGTNGIKYRHVYYVAELISNKIPKNNVTESQTDEIGEITFMNLSTATQTVRPYHKEKIKLLTSLTQYYFDTVYSTVKSMMNNNTNNNEN